MFSKHFRSGWISLVQNLSLLKYFAITLPRHKSSKIEGSGPPLMSHSIQLHCVCFRFSTVSKGKPFTQDVICKGYMFQIISSLLPVSNFIFGENSQKIDLNRIIRQRIFRFLNFEFFGSIPLSCYTWDVGGWGRDQSCEGTLNSKVP